MAKKKNPTDSTLRNVRAAKKRLTVLGRRLVRMETFVGKIGIYQGLQEARIRALERLVSRHVV